MTNWHAAILDLLEQKIGEAFEFEVSRQAALSEAAGAIPPLRELLQESEIASAQSILALGNALEERWASEWWNDFVKMDRGEFEQTAQDFVGPDGRLAILRKIVTNSSAHSPVPGRS